MYEIPNTMTDNQKLARWTGAMYILIIPTSMFALTYIPGTLTVSGDMVATVGNIVANETLFRWSILASVILQVLNIAVAFMLYKLFSGVDKFAAAMVVALFCTGVSVGLASELFSMGALMMAKNPEFPSHFVGLFLDLRELGIMINHTFWCLWLIPIGYLVYKSNFIPKFIGALLMVGAFGYAFDVSASIVAPDIGFLMSWFLFVGEALFPFWLLIKGIKEIPQTDS